MQLDLWYLLRGTTALTIAGIGTGLLSFAVQIALTHWLSKEAFGLFRYIISIYGIATIFVLTGLNVALTRSIARGAEADFIPIFYRRLLVGCLGGVALLCTGLFYLFRDDHMLFISCSIVS